MGDQVIVVVTADMLEAGVQALRNTQLGAELVMFNDRDLLDELTREVFTRMLLAAPKSV